MSRIEARFDYLHDEGRGALIPFLEACDPDRDTSMAILRGMPAAGATVAGVLGMAREFREGDDATPVALMGYLNPVPSCGPERFCADAAGAGVDGFVLVDLPTEEADLPAGHASTHGLDIVRLVSSTTDAARLPLVLQGESGFVHYVGITCTRNTAQAAEAMQVTAAAGRARPDTALRVLDQVRALAEGVRGARVCGG